MHWHHALVCTRTSHDIRCECMVWVDSMFSVDLGKSTPCLVLDRLSRGHGKIDIVVGVDGGLSGMGLRPKLSAWF